jgi:predicted 3-demethylubiquinone-9 3-methyltransferase (glyoxalase superfamily)
MKHNLHPCLWMNGNAKEAATFYCSLFADSSITTETPLVIKFNVNGEDIMLLNGGPQFQLNPSISFSVVCETDEEINTLFAKLSAGGKVLMPLDKYEWSERYAFLQDRFGTAWQLIKGKYSDVNQKLTPCLLFVNKSFGKAEAAMRFYTDLFPASFIEGILLYSPEEQPMTGAVKHAQFVLDGKVFMVMDGYGEHGFSFNEAFSFVVECDTQEEIDFYWNKLTEDGGAESMCGWLKDKFGVSWQIIPKVLGDLMSNKENDGKVMHALLQMKKLDIHTLQKVATV